jgi:dipeptide/tripeptide permease
MLIDYKIIIALNSGSFDSTQIINLLKDRIKDLSSFSIVAVLTYLSFFYFIVFQPLTKEIKPEA